MGSRYLLRRVATACFTIVMIVVLNFVLFRAMPGSPERILLGRMPGVTADDAFARAQQIVLHSFNMKDPPSHTRIRQLVQQAFTRAAIDEQRGRITELVDALKKKGLV